jgi:hypothetical protein
MGCLEAIVRPAACPAHFAVVANVSPLTAPRPATAIRVSRADARGD